MQAADWVPIIVALIGGTGAAGGLKAFVTVVRLLRNGVSPREGKRKVDIVQQRDEALVKVAEIQASLSAAVVSAEKSAARADAELVRADWADENRQIAVENEQKAREHAADVRYRLINAGVKRDDLPAWPLLEEPVPRAELKRRIQDGQRTNHPTVDDEPEYYNTWRRAEVDEARWRPGDQPPEQERRRHRR